VGASSEAPFGKVIFTWFLYTSLVLMNSVVRPHWGPSSLPLFDDLTVGLVYDLAHFRDRLPAPVAEFLLKFKV
jgi:hypothetical protein